MNPSPDFSNSITSTPKLCYGVQEAAKAVDLSRALLFQKIASGELKSFLLHSRRLIHADDLKAFIEKYRNPDGGLHAA